MSMGMASSSMVQIRNEPLSLHFSTMYGPSHLSLLCPWNIYIFNHTTLPNLLAGNVFLWGVYHAIFFFQVGLPLSGEGPKISAHPIHLAEVTFPFLDGWDLGSVELPSLMCYIQILLTSEPSSHRPTHRVWTLWWFSSWCYRPRWPQLINLPNILCCCSLP